MCLKGKKEGENDRKQILPATLVVFNLEAGECCDINRFDDNGFVWPYLELKVIKKYRVIDCVFNILTQCTEQG